MRAVKCVVGSYGAVMDDTECNAATRPTDTQVRRASFSPSSIFISLLLPTAHSHSLFFHRCDGNNLKLIYPVGREVSVQVHAQWQWKQTQTNTYFSLPPGLLEVFLSDLVRRREKFWILTFRNTALPFMDFLAETVIVQFYLFSHIASTQLECRLRQMRCCRV